MCTWRLLDAALRGQRCAKTRVATTEAHFALPLHIKEVGTMMWDVLRGWASPAQATELEYASRMFNPTAGLDVGPIAHIFAQREAAITEADVGLLCARGLIVECPWEEIHAWCNVFSVREHELSPKARRRLIAEPALNALFPDPGHTQLCSHREIFDGVRSGAAVCADFPWFYGQFRLDIAARRWFGFRWGGRAFTLCTVPTGARTLPALAQTALVILHSRVAQDWRIPPHTFNGYIDNVRLHGEERAVVAAFGAFREAAETAGLTLDARPLSEVVEYEYDFLGVRCNHRQKVVTNTEKTLAKLRRLGDPTTMRGWLSALGLCMFATEMSAATRLQLWRFYYMFKFIRRRVAAGVTLDDETPAWRGAIDALHEWRDRLLADDPRPVANERAPTVVIFSDACLVGYGVVIFTADSLVIRSGTFSDCEDISILEQRAAVYAWREVTPSEAPATAIHYVDNTSTLATIRRMRARSFLPNQLAASIADAARQKNYSVHAEYVPSQLNLSDGPSRLGFRFRATLRRSAWASWENSAL